MSISPLIYLSQTRRTITDYGLATLIMALSAVVAFGVGQVLSLSNVLLVLLIGVLLSGTRTSVAPAIWSAFLGFLAYNFLFTEPVFTFHMIREEDVLTVSFFLLVAVVTGNMAARIRQQMLALRESRDRTTSHLTLSRKLSAAPDRETILSCAMNDLFARYGLASIVVQPCTQHDFAITAATRPSLELATQDVESARRVWNQRLASDQCTGGETSSRYWFLPLQSKHGVLALLGILITSDMALSPDQKQQIEVLCQQVSQALERVRLVEDLGSARITSETERLRSALLSSISHDLRTPLTSMIGSIGSLLSYGERIPASERKELLQATLDEAERLNRYIQNMLDMTRLGHGLKIQRDWATLDDIIGAATRRLRSVLSPYRLRIHLAPDVPLLYVHAALIEQAVVNILENAARFSPEHGVIQINAYPIDDEVRLDIVDEGPGIAPEDRGKIFDMFYSATQGDRKQGTGLGLSICQGMVAAHGGSVEALPTNSGVGTCLRVRLPLSYQSLIPAPSGNSGDDD